jgi:hypothetical protein
MTLSIGLSRCRSDLENLPDVAPLPQRIIAMGPPFDSIDRSRDPAKTDAVASDIAVRLSCEV